VRRLRRDESEEAALAPNQSASRVLIPRVLDDVQPVRLTVLARAFELGVPRRKARTKATSRSSFASVQLVRGELRVQISEQIQRTSSTGRRGDFARPCGSPGKDPRFRAADRGRPVDNPGWAGETFPCIDKGLRALLRRRHRGRAQARADADVQRQRLQSLFMHSPAAVAMTFAAASESVFTSSARCRSRQQTPAPRLQPQDRVDLRAVRRDAL